MSPSGRKRRRPPPRSGFVQRRFCIATAAVESPEVADVCPPHRNGIAALDGNLSSPSLASNRRVSDVHRPISPTERAEAGPATGHPADDPGGHREAQAPPDCARHRPPRGGATRRAARGSQLRSHGGDDGWSTIKDAPLTKRTVAGRADHPNRVGLGQVWGGAVEEGGPLEVPVEGRPDGEPTTRGPTWSTRRPSLCGISAPSWSGGAWHALANRLRQEGFAFLSEPHIRFTGQPGEQATLLLVDPNANALGFKSFKDMGRGFAI